MWTECVGLRYIRTFLDGADECNCSVPEQACMARKAEDIDGMRRLSLNMK